jgi:hypothetical protein
MAVEKYSSGNNTLAKLQQNEVKETISGGSHTKKLFL